MPLNDRQIRNAKPADKLYKLADGNTAENFGLPENLGAGKHTAAIPCRPIPCRPSPGMGPTPANTRRPPCFLTAPHLVNTLDSALFTAHREKSELAAGQP